MQQQKQPEFTVADRKRKAWDGRPWTEKLTLARTPEGRAALSREYWTLWAGVAKGGFFYYRDKEKCDDLAELLGRTERVRENADRCTMLDAFRALKLLAAAGGGLTLTQRAEQFERDVAAAAEKRAAAGAAVTAAKEALAKAEAEFHQAQCGHGQLESSAAEHRAAAARLRTITTADLPPEGVAVAREVAGLPPAADLGTPAGRSPAQA
jgi:hypothetical protein